MPHPSRSLRRLKQVNGLAQPQDLLVRVAELQIYRCSSKRTIKRARAAPNNENVGCWILFDKDLHGEERKGGSRENEEVGYRVLFDKYLHGEDREGGSRETRALFAVAKKIR